MKQTVLIPQDFEAGATKSLVDAGLDVVTVDKLTDQIMLDHADTLVGAVVHLEKIDPAVFKQLPHLKILARTGVGYENVDDKSDAENGIYVTITPKVNFRTVSDRSHPRCHADAISQHLAAHGTDEGWRLESWAQEDRL